MGLAAKGTKPTTHAIGEWLKTSPAAQQLAPDNGALSPSALDTPGSLARALGFLNGESTCTDLGNVLASVEAFGEDEPSDPFAYSLPIRWVLWVASASTEPGLWRAAFLEWRPDIGLYDWLIASARKLAAAGDLGILSAVLEKAETPDTPTRTRAVEQYAKPWLKQLEVLGWSGSLPRLNAWAQATPEIWTGEQVWDSFRVAENLEPTVPTVRDLYEVIEGLPEALRGLDGGEAATSVVQLFGVARGLAKGHIESWFGESWASLLREARAHGVYEKAGAEASRSNLAWSGAAIRAVLEVPAKPATPEVTDHEGAGRDCGSQPDEAEPVPPTSDEEAASPSGAPPPATLPTPLSPADERARTWLRAMAWWAMGPTAGDVFVSGHDSWGLARWTLEHWLQPVQSKFWEKRTAAISLNGKSSADWLPTVVRSFEALASGSLFQVIRRPREYSPASLQIAFRKSPRDAADPCKVIEEWIASGNREWEFIERASYLWAAASVESSLWAVDDLRAALSQVANGRANEALGVLRQLGVPSRVRRFSVEGRIAVVGEVTDERLEQTTDVELVRMKEPVAPFEIVSFRMERDGQSVREVADRCVREATQGLLAACPGVRVLQPPQPTAVFDQDGKPVRLEVVDHLAPEAGYGPWWGSSRWFTLRRIDDIEKFWAPSELAEYQRSRQHDAAVERLLGLWVTLEHPIADGADGRSVIECLTKASVAVVVRELCRDISEIAGLLGEPLPTPRARWVDWADWKWAPGCPWAAGRYSRFRDALVDMVAFKKRITRAAEHTAWVLSAVYSARNRRVHEAYRVGGADEPMLARLDTTACTVVRALLERREAGQWNALGALVAAVAEIDPGSKIKPAALLDELHIPCCDANLGVQ